MRRRLTSCARIAVTRALCPLRAAHSTLDNTSAPRPAVVLRAAMHLPLLSSLTHTHAQALYTSRRHISSLRRLLQEEQDVFLDAVQTLELSRIADLAEAKAAGTEEHKDENDDAKKNDVEASKAEQQQRAAVKVKGDEGREAQHMYEALCAVNAVLRVLCEDSPVTLPVHELQAAMRVYTLVQRTRMTNAQLQAKWAADFVPEVREFALLYKRAGGDIAVAVE